MRPARTTRMGLEARGWPAAYAAPVVERGSVLVAVPAFGLPHLSDAVLEDLLRDPLPPGARVVVVDNGGSYEPAVVDERVTVHRPGTNLRWIGATNWALTTAIDEQVELVVVLNNDTRLSRDFLTRLVRPFSRAGNEDVVLVSACYDDFWLHQRATALPATAAEYAPVDHERDVPFCDGTALAFSVPRIAEIGLLDVEAFPFHGYGSDIDLALRAHAAGLRCLVTEGAYVAHLRRQTMNDVGRTGEQNRAEILAGLDGKWGQTWRAQVGLGPGAFPARNTGSAATWYL
jgi:GT2 family glycosyltransferase